MSDLIAAANVWRHSEQSERYAKRLLDAEIRKAHAAGMSEFAIAKCDLAGLDCVHRVPISRSPLLHILSVHLCAYETSL